MSVGITSLKCNQQTVVIESLVGTGIKMTNGLTKGGGLARQVQERVGPEN